MEHRCGKRIATNVPVSLTALPGVVGVGRVLNMSTTGAFIQTRLSLPPLSLVYLEALDERLRTPGWADRVAACVIRQGVSGVGVEWLDTAPGWVLASPIESSRHSADELA